MVHHQLLLSSTKFNDDDTCDRIINEFVIGFKYDAVTAFVTVTLGTATQLAEYGAELATCKVYPAYDELIAGKSPPIVATAYPDDADSNNNTDDV